MSTVNPGDTVKVHYTGTLDDGRQFDSSSGREPLEFTVGAGQVISGFDEAVTGMSVGDSKTITIPSDRAYGQHTPEKVQMVPRATIPDDIDLQQGTVLHAEGPQGQSLSFVVVGVDDEQVTVDGNHPLAGQNLTFDLELVAIV